MATGEEAGISKQEIETDCKEGEVNDFVQYPDLDNLQKEGGEQDKDNRPDEKKILTKRYFFHTFSPKSPAGLIIRTTAIRRNWKTRASWGMNRTPKD
jgi:hypothetical protein